MFAVFVRRGFRKLPLYVYYTARPDVLKPRVSASTGDTLAQARQVETIVRWVEHACGSIVWYSPALLTEMPSAESVIEFIAERLQASKAAGASAEFAARIAYLTGIGQILSKHPQFVDTPSQWSAGEVLRDGRFRMLALDVSVHEAALSVSQLERGQVAELGFSWDSGHQPMVQFPPM
ncbi:hypothetical protein [Streptomyces noursei]|uniref:Uncharacterized protein n=1 Tax=Streptomyces noursei TaxID=1971 RepID=A0A2N8PQS3_STRNR|nr:hypothetical protein [Streptomyces noursei]PNE43367.1 hypothetical protein AOB60_00005 [Streptomyces noursei]